MIESINEIERDDAVTQACERLEADLRATGKPFLIMVGIDEDTAGFFRVEFHPKDNAAAERQLHAAAYEILTMNMRRIFASKPT